MLLVTAIACAERAESKIAKSKLVHDQHAIQFVWNVAVLANEPDLCEKIPSDLVKRLGFNPKEHQIFYQRSGCYNDVAMTFGDIALCDHVKEKSHVFLSGSDVSRKTCEQKVRAGLSANTSHSRAPSMTSEIFLQQIYALGYVDATAHEYLPVPALQPDYAKTWNGIPDRSDLFKRVTKVVGSQKSWDQSSTVTVAEHDFLLGMAAELSQSIDWCLKMSAGSRVPAKGNMGAHSFKNYCVLDVARRTDCHECCEKIVGGLSQSTPQSYDDGRRRPQGAGHDRIMYLSCLQSTTENILYDGGKTVHQIIDPMSDEHTRRFIEILGYPLPTVAELSAYEKQKRYRQLFVELGKNPKLKKDLQVKQLLEKIYQLQN
ncbi:MAG: hypothetical protein HKM24_05185 [Gammaproteobacteria bacterium]|nr:hypothetical protein [Gammaproteobacteria bacterium]